MAGQRRNAPGLTGKRYPQDSAEVAGAACPPWRGMGENPPVLRPKEAACADENAIRRALFYKNNWRQFVAKTTIHP